MSKKTIDVDCPNRHVDQLLPIEWFSIQVNDTTIIVNEAGEGSVSSYTLGESTKNPRVIANASAILWEGIVALTHYEDDLVTISHQFSGIEDRLPIDIWLDEPVICLERTEMVDLKGVGGIVEFDCIGCGEHIKREQHKMDIPGVTPSRCTSCTFGKMGQP